MNTIFESERTFEIWRYLVSHRQLLLCSNRTEEHETRIEVLFKSVESLKLPTYLDGLTVRSSTASEEAEIRDGFDFVPRQDILFFVVEGKAYRGYVAAGAVFTSEDAGSYDEPSALFVGM